MFCSHLGSNIKHLIAQFNGQHSHLNLNMSKLYSLTWSQVITEERRPGIHLSIEQDQLLNQYATFQPLLCLLRPADQARSQSVTVRQSKSSHSPSEAISDTTLPPPPLLLLLLLQNVHAPSQIICYFNGSFFNLALKWFNSLLVDGSILKSVKLQIYRVKDEPFSNVRTYAGTVRVISFISSVLQIVVTVHGWSRKRIQTLTDRRQAGEETMALCITNLWPYQSRKSKVLITNRLRASKDEDLLPNKGELYWERWLQTGIGCGNQ